MSCGDDDPRARSSTEFNMNPPTLKPEIDPGHEDESPAASLRRIVHKSALLNLVIVLISFPVLVLAGGPKAIVPTLMIMTGITFVIWTATFTLFSCVSVGRILWAAFTYETRRKPREPARKAGVPDRWLDGPC
jgi:hypothetical protein